MESGEVSLSHDISRDKVVRENLVNRRQIHAPAVGPVRHGDGESVGELHGVQFVLGPSSDLKMELRSRHNCHSIVNAVMKDIKKIGYFFTSINVSKSLAK